MEITGNKYLHKKFKKQTSCSPIYNVEDKNDNVLIPVVSNGQCGEIYAQKLLSSNRGSTEKKAVNFLLFKDNNYLGSVPNVKSTNYDGSLVTDRSSELVVDSVANDTLDNQSSISKVAVSINVATTCSSVVTKESEECKNKYRISDEANIVRQNDQKNMMNLVKTSNVTSCISTTTTTSLLANELKENIRNFSFDTEVNISEPSTQKHDKSSIFDTVYSKYSVISELPNATGIKSDMDEMANKSSGIIYNKSDTSDSAQKPEAITPEKKQNCPEPNGGKYVCTYCNLACSKPSVLQKHIRAHTNERPYPCVSCGFSFKTRSNLYKHCRSRTHANRVMGNKHVQAGASQMDTMDIDSSLEKNEDRLDCADEYIEDKPSNEKIAEYSKFNVNNLLTSPDQSKVWEQKSKPYKPRFHTAKIFFEENKLKENDSKLDNVTSAHFRALPNPIIIENIKNKTDSQESQNIRSNPDILKLRINELIHKNNSIMNCDDAVVIRRRNVDTSVENVNNNEYISQQLVHWQQPAEYKNTVDEPLNLTAKNRKRCLSDSDNTQKSLIKELLLKNLSTDPNLQCPYCKMIFQTVTELEMHKLKYCNAKTSNIRYARSSSVNVASILTQNKNAFDNIPHMQHTTFPLKSPGPCLGKTRLIENEKQTEKYRTFSFDDNVILHHTQSDSPSFNKYMLQSAVGTYPLSPQIKKNPIRLFGGEVKITQTSGETRSFKIESESINKMQEEPQHFMEFSANLSENLVIKSGLHSGGTVLQNKTNYSPKIDSLPSPNILRMYDNSDMVSPSLNLQLLNDKPKFTFDNITQPNMCQNDKLLKIATNEQFTKRGFPCRDKSDTNYSDNGLLDSEKEKELYKSNLIDFGQKACKLLAPNLKTPNIKLSGLPISLTSSDKIYNTLTVTMAPSDIEKESPIDKQHLENLNFAKKQISLQQKMAEVSQSQHVYNPMNLFVNGKVIPYVPGIPGPVADVPTDHIYNPMAIGARSKYSIEMPNSPRPIEDKRELKEKDNNSPVIMPVLNTTNPYERKTPTIIVDYAENRSKSDTKSLSNKAFSNFDKPVEAVSRIAETKTTPSSATVSSPDKMSSKEESRRFVRPTSLALKPTLGTFKSHHGLTPTMFNQALISPDTPRVAKKYCQQYLNGNYFSYLGLKSSTKSVYCTLNKTQPFYVKHFKKLSMYSEWRQQESKIDSLSVSAYDSRQQQQKYTMAGHAKADFIAHSSYKFIKTESSCLKEDGSNKSNSVFGGYKSNEDYTYIKGRGRGRYVCEQCGIRCKKPSMLKKHIRTHSDDRPYTCEHCNFSFKTKGNLTKHMNSKAHSKKYAATSSTLTQNSVSTSSDSDESDGKSSDESTRLQEHEAAHCLLSLAHKNNQPFNITQETNSSISSTFPSSSTTVSTFNLSEFPNFLKDDKFLKDSDEISQVTNTNFAKNKILDETSANFHASKHLSEVFDTVPNSSSDVNNVSQYLGESEKIRPLTYPYLQTNFEVEKSPKTTESSAYIPKEKYQNQESITTVSDLQRPVIKHTEYNKFEATSQDSDTFEAVFAAKCAEEVKNNQISVKVNNLLHNLDGTLPTNIVYRKRKLSSCSSQYKVQRSENVESNYKAVDLRVLNLNSPVLDLSPAATSGETFNGFIHHRDEHSDHKIVQCHRTLMLNQENQISDVPQSLEVVSSSSDQHLLYSKPINDRISEPLIVFSTQKPRHNSFSESNSSETFSQNSDTNERIIGKIIDPSENSDKTNDVCMLNRHADRSRSKTPDYLADQDQSAMQTLAEIAIKRVKLEKNILAKNVASEYLKLALNCDGNNTDGSLKKFVAGTKETVNELIVKPEDNKNCSICSKNFSKPSQLRLHMNIHYLERPFRCETCSVSFRTKGHLQKHERSASHHNKLSTSPALSSSEPRPFKCTDCNIAFRIHGHLAKHLRSKMHIMKLECLSKIPFGLYAELERANSLLTEINTTDGDLCLESLKILARKLFSNDPNKLDQVNQSDRQES